MAWITCCPSCRTTFRVTPEELTQADAWLRCSQCQRVFDSTGLVVSWDEPLTLTKPEPEEEPTAQGAPPAREATRATALWAAVVLMLCLLPALLVVQQRQALLVKWPALWPVFSRVCAVTRCELAAVSRAQDLVIDTSSLTPQSDGYAVTAVLRNTAPWPVRPAALELTLLDGQEQPVVRRVFLPDVLKLSQTLQPEQTIALRLAFTLDASVGVVTGYRLRSIQP